MIFIRLCLDDFSIATKIKTFIQVKSYIFYKGKYQSYKSKKKKMLTESKFLHFMEDYKSRKFSQAI